ncbi:hypothetical protein EDD18DRAFT_1108030 [Armillaria luteobubalina]|uniref:Uncharacterized protein n=1 Tax=Armillaria luteobubalina TaxID=153913 RepID=A0AA39UUQ1_9AGAR|nr:hypothetical protein EDD18DRAFT_1108030 [Armillaria luteobubalina]
MPSSSIMLCNTTICGVFNDGIRFSAMLNKYTIVHHLCRMFSQRGCFLRRRQDMRTSSCETELKNSRSGYDRVGWMVVTLEMKAGNGGRWFEYGPHVWRRWLRNARNGCPLMSRHFFRHREHVESLGLENLGSSILSIGSSIAQHTNPSSTMDRVEIEVPVEDLFVGYMIAQLCRPEMAHHRQTEDRFK